MRKLAFVFALLILAIPCQARVITVDDDGPADFNNIQAGINDANDGDVVIVAPGTYIENININGKNIVLTSTDPNNSATVETTIIKGSGHGSVITLEGTETSSCKIRGLTIMGGDTFFNDVDGAGIFGNGALAQITNCIIRDNNGGGLGRCDGIISGCTIDGNPWARFGAGLYKCNGPISDCNISYNTAHWAGGGLYRCDGELTNCIINNNKGMSGGLDSCNGPIINCTISGNIGTYSGGGLNSCNGPITNCIIRGNSAERDGGGLHNCDGVISNSIISGNWAAEKGGGLSRKAKMYNSNPMLINCTISGNSAGDRGGGINNYYDPITSCIIWGNSPDQIYSDSTSVTYSDVEGGWDGAGNIDVDPKFVAPALGDYHLSFDSTCINSGNPFYTCAPGETDIDGDPRVMDGRVDIGVDEAPVTVPIIRIAPAEFEFDANEDGPLPEQQILYVSYIGAGIINWQVTEDCPWLEVDPTDGESTSGLIEVTLNINITGLEPGIYNCEFTVTADGINGSPHNVRVTLHLSGIKIHVPSQFSKIQDAIDHVQEGGTVIVEPGLYLEPDGGEEINFLGKNITLTSIDPTNRDIVNNTVIRGSVQFSGTENPNCKFTGFKIQDERYGAIYGNQTHATISHCILNRNGPCYGTVILGCDGLISNCEITDNFTLWLCGVWPAIDECHGLIKNCTIANNVSGVGVWRGGTTTIQNCIIYHNYEDPYSQLGVWAEGTLNISYCDVQGGQGAIYMEDPCNCTINWGPGNIDIDPCFVRLGYMDSNGTPDDWRDDFWVEGDYHLRENSPCIDAGDPKYIPEQNEMDLDGNPRIVDEDNDGNSVVDMGAYEVQVAEPAELIAQLIEEVGELELPRGIENSLIAKLNAALRALEDENENNDAAAVNTLEAFINAVEAQRGKKIPEAEADALIAKAQEIIDMLSDG